MENHAARERRGAERADGHGPAGQWIARCGSTSREFLGPWAVIRTPCRRATERPPAHGPQTAWTPNFGRRIPATPAAHAVDGSRAAGVRRLGAGTAPGAHSGWPDRRELI